MPPPHFIFVRSPCYSLYPLSPPVLEFVGSPPSRVFLAEKEFCDVLATATIDHLDWRSPVRERGQHVVICDFAFHSDHRFLATPGGFTAYLFLHSSTLQRLVMDVLRKRMEVHLTVHLVAKTFRLH